MKRQFFIFLLIPGLLIWGGCDTTDSEDSPDATPGVSSKQEELSYDTPPRVVWMPQSTPPKAVNESNHAGMITLGIRISTDGIVDSIWIAKSSKNTELDDWALSILRQTTFTPGRKDGKPIAVVTEFPIVLRPSE